MKVGAWIFLLIASFFEIGWMYSLRYLDFIKIKNTTVSLYFKNPDAATQLLPLAGYVCFGFANIFFFSKALKVIPASAAFGVWMALTLTGSKLIDVIFLEDHFSMRSIICMILILAGIAGLRWE